MYIAAGLPIICWTNMAVADFVEKNKIGICINNLNEINNKLKQITDEQYSAMQKNVLKIQNRVRKGEYIRSAINKI